MAYDAAYRKAEQDASVIASLCRGFGEILASVAITRGIEFHTQKLDGLASFAAERLYEAACEHILDLPSPEDAGERAEDDARDMREGADRED